MGHLYWTLPFVPGCLSASLSPSLTIIATVYIQHLFSSLDQSTPHHLSSRQWYQNDDYQLLRGCQLEKKYQFYSYICCPCHLLLPNSYAMAYRVEIIREHATAPGDQKYRNCDLSVDCVLCNSKVIPMYLDICTSTSVGLFYSRVHMPLFGGIPMKTTQSWYRASSSPRPKQRRTMHSSPSLEQFELRSSRGSVFSLYLIYYIYNSNDSATSFLWVTIPKQLRTTSSTYLAIMVFSLLDSLSNCMFQQTSYMNQHE